MASKAKSSLGAVLSVETATTGTYIAIEEITSIPPMLGDKAGKIDVTNMNSTGYKEYIRDMFDAPEVTITCNWTGEAGQQRIQSLGSTGTKVNFKLVFNDPLTTIGTTIIRQGYVSSNPNIEAALGKQMTFSFSVQFTGTPTVTAAV